MIINHIVRGSIFTSIHDFEIRTDGRTIILSKGRYFQRGKEIIQTETESILEVSSPGYYDVWLTTNGFELSTGEEVTEPVDRLAWFNLRDETDLTNVEIHFVKVVE